MFFYLHNRKYRNNYCLLRASLENSCCTGVLAYYLLMSVVVSMSMSLSIINFQCLPYFQKDESKTTNMELEKESTTNTEQNFDLVRIKKALEALRQEQLDAKNKDSDCKFISI